MFHQLPTHLKYRQKSSAAGHIFISLTVFKYLDEILSLVFDNLPVTDKCVVYLQLILKLVLNNANLKSREVATFASAGFHADPLS